MCLSESKPQERKQNGKGGEGGGEKLFIIPDVRTQMFTPHEFSVPEWEGDFQEEAVFFWRKQTENCLI